jgi:SET domain-containing protein
MLLFETELRESGIHGIGVFLLEPVKKGEIIWRFDARIDRVYSDAELREMPLNLQQFLRVYSTLHADSGLWVLCGDNGRHFNHSDAPNTVSQGIAFGNDIAGSDLAAGTELTSDYRTICDSVRLNGFEFNTRKAA